MEGIIADKQIIYYGITGSTASELRTSMDMLRLKDPYHKDRPVDAYTDWHISWNWPGYGTNNCDLSAAVLDYRIQIILPRWEPPVSASPELITQWNTYIWSLVLHEKGHVNNIVNHFDSNYDSETRHGETQGAVFP